MPEDDVVVVRDVANFATIGGLRPGIAEALALDLRDFRDIFLAHGCEIVAHE
jgi:hypothetical protein